MVTVVHVGHQTYTILATLNTKGLTMENKLTNKELSEIIICVCDMGWEYDRMSMSGQKAYDKLCKLLRIE